MKEEKKTRTGFADEGEIDSFKCMVKIAQAIPKLMLERHIESLEPFEVYAERIKTKLYEDPDQFTKKFIKGYQILLDELEKEGKNKDSLL
jgi:hypothetical protein